MKTTKAPTLGEWVEQLWDEHRQAQQSALILRSCDNCGAKSETIIELDNGINICLDCESKICDRCGRITKDVYESGDDYICLDCYTTEIDWTCDTMGGDR